MRFFKLIRYQNLILIGLIQSILWLYIIPMYFIEPQMIGIEFVLLVLSSICIAAGGNIINDIYDIEIDTINKPNNVWIPSFLSYKKAWVLYISITFIGLIFGWFTTIYSHQSITFIWFVIPVGILFLYAYKLKKILFINNVIIALLVTYSILVVVWMERNALPNELIYSFSYKKIIWFLVIFSFGLNWSREIVKDAQDLEGDKWANVNSIPAKYGIDFTKNFIQTILYFLMGIILAISASHFNNQPILVSYMILVILTSLILLLIKLRKSNTIMDFNDLSFGMKLLMLLGILSVFFIR